MSDAAPNHLVMRPLEPHEFEAWRDRARHDYGADIARNVVISDETAARRSRETFDKMLPDGLGTADNYIGWLVSGHEVVGSAWYSLDPVDVGIVMFICDLIVDPEHRGQGFGRQAMELFDRIAAESGANRIALSVFGHNDIARSLYESCGFHVTSSSMVKPLER